MNKNNHLSAVQAYQLDRLYGPLNIDAMNADLEDANIDTLKGIAEHVVALLRNKGKMTFQQIYEHGYPDIDLYLAISYLIAAERVSGTHPYNERFSHLSKYSLIG